VDGYNRVKDYKMNIVKTGMYSDNVELMTIWQNLGFSHFLFCTLRLNHITAHRQNWASCDYKKSVTINYRRTKQGAL
jgi:hypothetical protein